MSDQPAADGDDGIGVDPEAALDRLIDVGVLSEADDGTLSTTDEFESERGVYRDTYMDVEERVFHETVAELFGLDHDEAADAVEENEVTREEVVAYLTLREFLDDPPDAATLAVMAGIVAEVGPGTPVPPAITEVTDDVEAFLADHPDAIVTVWLRDCAPCEAMKGDLDAILDAIPAGVAVAGVGIERDRELAAFLREHDVDAAPAVVAFRDGEHRATRTGRQTPEDVADLCEEVF